MAVTNAKDTRTTPMNRPVDAATVKGANSSGVNADGLVLAWTLMVA